MTRTLQVASAAVSIAILVTFGVAARQPAATASIHGKPTSRLIVRNAMVIYGNAKPPYGPADIVVENGVIAAITMPAAAQRSDANAVVIDGTGKYVMPGIVNAHMHWHEERQPGMAQPIQYERNLYLAAGVTTVRDVGGDFEKSKRWQAESNAHAVASPRILVYPFVSKGRTGAPDEIRVWIRDVKKRGADGLKIIGVDRDQLEAIMDEAHKLDLRTATHIGVEETNARDYAELGVTSIEHFYGVADAALTGVQNFPPDMNYANEVHRFGRAGELYAQADRDQLHKIIDLMVEKHVAWDPTFSIYEASRDLVRAQNQPWFRDYLHPSMEEYFRASTENHGSYFFGWTSTQESRWREQYRIWMDAVREFARKGGLVTTGDDAGYIYSMYGFGISRELELHEEGRVPPARSDRARDVERREAARPRRSDRQGPRRLRRRSPRRQRQPAGESEAAQSVRHRCRARERTAGIQLPFRGCRGSDRERARRRHRMDDQGRHSVSRPDADARRARDGRPRTRGATAKEHSRAIDL
jgi:hypothetical protein